MTEKVAIYTRYSSDLQRERSLEDQERLCRDYADRQGWEVGAVFSDATISGASLDRKGCQALVGAVRSRLVTIVLAEAVARLSRKQTDLLYLFDVMRFNGVRLHTCDTGENNALLLAIKGIISEQYRTDVGNKTRRGQAGRVREGRSGGGRCYGYDIVRVFGPDGLPVPGLLTVNEEQAAVVRRIFREFAGGKSARRIAKELNEESIPSPRGKLWGGGPP